MSLSEKEMSCEADRLDAQDTLRYVIIALAVVIWVVFSFFQRRVSFYTTSLKGVPGIVYPLDPIHTSRHRIVYLVAYGAVAGELMNLILGSASGDTSGGIRSIWATSLIGILRFLEASVICFPLFACVDAPIPVLGYVTGVLFVPLLFSRQIMTLSVLCLEQNNAIYKFQLADQLVFTLPILIFLSTMFLWYLVSAVREFHRLIVTPHSLYKALFEHTEETLYHAKYVRSLLSRPLKTTSHTRVHRLLSFLYPYNSNVQLPLRFLAAMVIMIYAVYLLTVSLIFSTVTLSILLGQLYDTVKVLSSTLVVLNSTAIAKALDYGADALYAFRVVFPAGPIIAFAWNLVIMMQLIRTVRIHLQKIACGDHSFLAVNIPSPSFRLLNSIKYTSYQISYFVWSWILACTLVWIVGMAGLVLYYLFEFWQDEMLLLIATIMIPLLYTLILNYGQLLFVKLFFVGDTNNRHTVLRNRRLFYLFSYFVFFQNVVVGFISSFLRIVYSAVLGLVLFFRLDRVVLMKGFESLDKGHVTYVSFLYLEHTQNNSILLVFKDIFMELKNIAVTKELPADGLQKSYDMSTPHKAPLSKRARNRWLVAYTLLRNPTLQPLRARSGDLMEKVADICIPTVDEFQKV